MFKKLFLPVGLLVAMAAACLVPVPGAWLRAHGAVQIFVITIFVINGWTVKVGGEHLTRRLALGLAMACVLSLGVGPLLGTGVALRLLGLQGMVATGMVVMASVPVTLSSGIVITGVARGNVVWALLMTIGMNLLGILTVPFMLAICLQEGEGTHISAPALLLKLTLLVLVPFAVGHVARRLVAWRTPKAVGYVPSLCVILTVYAAFAASRDEVLRTDPRLLPIIVAAALTIHLSLMAIAAVMGRVAGLARAERTTLCFISSQKSLPIAVSVLTALGASSALALLPCLVFHFGQLLLDSLLATHWHNAAAVELREASGEEGLEEA